MSIKCDSGVSFTILEVSPLKCIALLAVNAIAIDCFNLYVIFSVRIVLCPSLNLGGYCRQTHAVWGGEGQDHQQPADYWANYCTTAMVIRYLRSANISLYHTMVLSAVTHSLVIGRKVRNEDPTADTSMVTRPPHHTYTILVARLLQTQIQKLLWILQIFPYNS